MGTKIKWGILGTAEIAREQMIPAIQRSSNAELVGIASLSGKSKGFAEKYDIPNSYQSYKELLSDPNIDAVYIPLPNHLHSEWVRLAAMHGKHILCEKPAAITIDDTKKMLEVCEHHDVLFMEAMMYQFHPQHLKVKELVKRGDIGDVKFMRAAFTFKLERIEDNFRLLPWSDGGGSLYDIGCYCIHAIREILGKPQKVLYCLADTEPSDQSDISAMAILEFKNQIKAYFDCGMNMSVRNEYEIVGTKGTIRVPKAFIPQSDGEGIIQVSYNDGRYFEERIYDDYYVRGVEHFSACVKDRQQPLYSKRDILNNIKVLNSCIEEAMQLMSS